MAVSPVAVDLALVAVAVLALGVGAAWFVAGAGRLARRAGVPGLVVGLTVVAFGTSAPEFAVTVEAALVEAADISVGNVVGSNVLNLGFVLGGVALVRALPTAPDLVRRDAPVLIGTTLLVAALLWNGRAGRLEGLLLLVLLVVYLAVLVRTGSDRIRADPSTDAGPLDVVRALGGLALVLGGARLLVFAASDVARAAGVSEWTIGVTIVAAGTSAPEFVTSLVAARRGRTALSAGNLVGSSVFNFLGVLGLAAAIRPLPVSPAALEGLAGLLVIVVVATLLFRSNDVLSRAEGGVLVALNAVDWLLDLL